MIAVALSILLLTGSSADQPDTARLLRVGRAYADRGDDAKAIAVLEQVVAASPGLVDAHQILGTCYARQRKHDLAAREFAKTIELDPKRYDAYLLLGMSRDFSKDYEGAMKVYRQAIQVAPDRFEAHRELGDTLLLVGRPKEAVEELEKASRLMQSDDPQDRADMDGELGYALTAAGRCADAKKALDRAAAAADSADVWVHLGDAEACLKDYDAGRKAYEKATQLDANNARAWFHLALVRVKVGDRDGAKAAVERAARISPDDAKVRELADELRGPAPPARGPAGKKRE